MTLSVRVYWTDDGDKIFAVVSGDLRSIADKVSAVVDGDTVEETYDVSDLVESFDTDAEVIRSVGTFLEEQGYTVTASTVWDIEEE